MKKQNPNPGMEILLVAGAGALVWWYLSQNKTTASTAGTTTTGGSTTTGTTTTGTTGTTTAPPPPPPATTPPPPPPAGSKPTLAVIGQNLMNVMGSSGDPAITGSGTTMMATPYVFNYYLALSSVNGGAFSSPPDVGVVFSGNTPGVAGVDLTQPMSFNQFWNGMSSYLRSNNGLSGLSAAYRARSPYFDIRQGGWLV